MDAAALIFDLRRQAAYGVNKHNISSLSQSLVQCKGDEMMSLATNPKEIQQAQNLIDAKCTKQWIKHNFGDRVQDTVAEEGRTKSFVRSSNLSLKRTSAANPLLQRIMAESFLAL